MRKHKVLVELRRYKDWDGGCLACGRASGKPHADDCVTENAAILIEQQHAEIEQLRAENAALRADLAAGVPSDGEWNEMHAGCPPEFLRGEVRRADPS